MELACDIIRRKTTRIKPRYIIGKIKKLNIVKYLNKSHQDFLYKAKKYCLPTFNHLARELFSNHDDDLGYALLLAYYISSYSDDIFNVKTEYENKLIMASNKVILYLQGTISNIDHEFYDTVDYYYSLYKIWNSPDLKKINILYDTLIDLCVKYKLVSITLAIYNDHKPIKKLNYINSLKRHQTQNTKIKSFSDKMIDIVNTMFIINNKMATKLLLQNYRQYVNIKAITNTLWKHIDNISDVRHIILIIIAELRIKIIHQSYTSIDKKDMYYKVNIEDMIRNIRNDTLTPKKINSIINLFTAKIQKIYPNSFIAAPPSSKIWSDEYQNSITNIFMAMFNILLQKNQK